MELAVDGLGSVAKGVLVYRESGEGLGLASGLGELAYIVKIPGIRGPRGGSYMCEMCILYISVEIVPRNGEYLMHVVSIGHFWEIK